MSRMSQKSHNRYRSPPSQHSRQQNPGDGAAESDSAPVTDQDTPASAMSSRSQEEQFYSLDIQTSSSGSIRGSDESSDHIIRDFLRQHNSCRASSILSPNLLPCSFNRSAPDRHSRQPVHQPLHRPDRRHSILRQGL